SVAKLAAAGVVDGYADGAFDGDKLMTRYEMAQIVAKAMAKGADCDKLAAEFADELDTLGVRVAKLEKGADAVKITGNIRYHYTQNDGDDKGHATKLRSRIFFKGAINDDWTYTGMLENEQDFNNEAEDNTTKFQRAYVEGKLGGLAVTAGRWSNLVAEGNIWDSRMDAVKAVYGKDVKLTAVVGKADASSPKQDYKEYQSYEVATKLGVVALNVGYYDFAKRVAASKGAVDGDKEIWAVNAAMPLAKDLKLGAMYLKGDANIAGQEDDGYVLTLGYKGAKASAPGSWGLTAKYYDQPLATYADHTMNGYADSFVAADGGFKGYGLFANYALAKNIVAQVEYYDLEAQETNVDVETLWTQVVFTF
ncbi:MAG: S-layer homology domain-containing protein, partial [Phascolarctobacterium sp.]|nr:S-layer homology domain-containing protein [Phascolarctobacterium sp.]